MQLLPADTYDTAFTHIVLYCTSINQSTKLPHRLVTLLRITEEDEIL